METLNFIERCGGVTKYFHDAWEANITGYLFEKKWDAIDLTGARFTLLILFKIHNYVKQEEENGHHVQVIDNRKLMQRAFDTLYKDVEIEQSLKDKPEMCVPTSVEDFKAKSAELAKGGIYRAPMPTASINSLVSASWFVYINLMFPKVQISYNPVYAGHLRTLFSECVNGSEQMQEQLENNDSLAIIMNTGALTKVYKTPEGKYDCGTYGQLTFREIQNRYCILPYGFGETAANPNGTSALSKLCSRVLTIVYNFIVEQEKKRVPMDLYSVLDRGYI